MFGDEVVAGVGIFDFQGAKVAGFRTAESGEAVQGFREVLDVFPDLRFREFDEAAGVEGKGEALVAFKVLEDVARDGREGGFAPFIVKEAAHDGAGSAPDDGFRNAFFQHARRGVTPYLGGFTGEVFSAEGVVRKARFVESGVQKTSQHGDFAKDGHTDFFFQGVRRPEEGCTFDVFFTGESKSNAFFIALRAGSF